MSTKRMEDIKRLERKRDALGERLNLFSKFITELPNIEITEIIIAELQSRLEKANSLFNEFENVQTSLENIVENLIEQIPIREQFENKCHHLCAVANQYINNFKCIQAEDNTSRVSHLPNTNNNAIEQSVKLPTIQLPLFYGSYDKWMEFHETFNSLIDKNSNINEIQKFHYLRSALRGEAADVIHSLEISAANYKVAWELLTDRYANKKLLVRNHVKAILHLRPIVKASSAQLRQLLDSVSKHLRALKSLGIETDNWDALLIGILIQKFDPDTAREWEAFISNIEMPNMKNFKAFIKVRGDFWENIESRRSSSISNSENQRPHREPRKTFISSTAICHFCQGNHKIYTCEDFLKLPVNSRLDKVRELKLCTNCLNTGHNVKTCRFGPCRSCKQRHNTLLHAEQKKDCTTSNSTEVSFSNYNLQNQQVLLSTALVLVLDVDGREHSCRALLDSGSQSNFLTSEFCKKLKLNVTNVNMSIMGINQVSSNIKHKCALKIRSCYSQFSIDLSCLVVPRIANCIPGERVDVRYLNIPRNITLADKTFYEPSSIDLLIGADVFWQLFLVGQVKLGPQLPILQNTRLGWIVSGPIRGPSSRVSRCHFIQPVDIENQISRFWELEEGPLLPTPSQEENECEKHFQRTYQRATNGRFIVTIPLRDSVTKLGDSKQNACKRFYKLEKRLQSNHNLGAAYIDFMTEYQALGHMTKIDLDPLDDQSSYYLPHHGVFKEGSLTTKLRVVFDGSCPSSSGVSINDLQMAGPVIQNDLFSILLRFRQHLYVVSADIEKMYRQVLIAPAQRPLQKIVWRSSPTLPLDTYLLNTVTYGTVSSSWLAIRCLKQLSLDNAERFPVASCAIDNDFYVDDFLSGGDCIEDLAHTCKQIADILSQGCFPLRKWVSNNPDVLRFIPKAGNPFDLLSLGNNENTKTLGILCSFQNDSLIYNINVPSNSKTSTKRGILSTISQIFDPLGLLSACIITSKIILQQVWMEKMDWDLPLPLYIHSRYIRFLEEMSEFNNFEIPRCIKCPSPIRIELHGFSDASTEAYGACLYVRSISKLGSIYVHLLCAKAKVAPLKTISVPRLELCGALTLARLARKVVDSTRFKFDSIHYWSDSTVVLGWIRTPSSHLKTFVSNRVSEIQTKTTVADWNHVLSVDNPADLLSRGVNPAVLKRSNIWWHGPHWMQQPSSNWPSFKPTADELPELRKNINSSFLVQRTVDFDFQRFSSFPRLKACFAYCLRFVRNCRLPRESRSTGPLTVSELSDGLIWLIKLVQAECFHDDISRLQRKGSLKGKCKIFPLSPFLDKDGVLRVGGRLRLSNFPLDKKHPIILPAKHRVTYLIFRYEHLRLYHAGPQQLLYSIRERFWPISGRNTARRIVHECITCFKAKSQVVQYKMSDLPMSRVTPSPPFYFTGVDYAGPFLLRDRIGRGAKLYKAYLCLFVCLATKAIHLELVTTLSTEAFIASLRRFVSRRGRPLRIHSDNGPNFVGANAQLQELYQFLKKSKNELVRLCANDEIQFHFIPSNTPHFGGIWEAGIKSAKYHIKRVLGNANLTYENFYTILTQIEAALNSRPLSPLSTDPDEMLPLTPGHFLIGRSLTEVADPDIRHIKEGRLSHYQRLQQIKQHFWDRWSREYIGELQRRTKWYKDNPNVLPGAMVLLRERNAPPMCWPLGRIIKVHPGKDGVVRVVTVKTSKGVVLRSVVNLAPLPFSETMSPETHIGDGENKSEIATKFD